MRKLASLCLLVLAAVVLAGCHDGYHSYGYSYSSGPACRPVYYDCAPRYHHRHGHCDY